MGGEVSDGEVRVGTVGEKEPDGLLVLVQDGGDERREAVRARIRIGARLEEELGEREEFPGEDPVPGELHDQVRRLLAHEKGVPEIPVDGEREGGEPPRRRRIHVGSGRNQVAGRRQVTGAGGEHERGVAAVKDPLLVLGMGVRGLRGELVPGVGGRVHIRPVFQEDRDDIRVPLGRREHERGLSARGPHIDARPPFEEHPHDGGAPGP